MSLSPRRSRRVSSFGVVGAVVLAFGGVGAARGGEGGGARPLGVGVDAGYALQMERAGRGWSVDGAPVEPFAAFARAGCGFVRVRVWTGDTGPSGRSEAAEVALRAQRAGLEPHLVYFLSDGWADLVKQPAPAAWAGLGDADRAAAIEAYTEATTRWMVERGVHVSVVEVGNEIDFGVAGIFEEDWAKRVSVPYMGSRVWPRVVPLLAAAQRGVRRVVPDARFVVHLARWHEPAYAIAFWRAMIEGGVTVDYAGLSYFPSSVEGEAATLDGLTAQVAAIHGAIGRPVLLSEVGYPSAPVHDGPFATWDRAVPGHPVSPEGQRAWAGALAGWTHTTPHVAGATYWSPEWYDSPLWAEFALFDPEGRARPALTAWCGAGTAAAP